MAALIAEGKNGRFHTSLSRSRATPIPEVGVAPNSPRVSRDVWRILTPSLKPVATIVFKVKIFVLARSSPFSQILPHISLPFFFFFRKRSLYASYLIVPGLCFFVWVRWFMTFNQWLCKTTPPTIKISLYSGFDDALGRKRPRRHYGGKRLPSAIWFCGLRSFQCHSPLLTFLLLFVTWNIAKKLASVKWVIPVHSSLNIPEHHRV